jgi:hypothetical protein
LSVAAEAPSGIARATTAARTPSLKSSFFNAVFMVSSKVKKIPTFLVKAFAARDS